MTGNIAAFIRARITEERDRRQNVGYLPFREAVLGALEAILGEHSDAGPGISYVNGERIRVRHACSACSGPIDEYAADWPCRTIREVAWVWVTHPDHDTAAWDPLDGPWT